MVRQSKANPVSTVTPVTTRTVRWILACNGLHGCIATQKPALNKKQLRNRVVNAKAHTLKESWTAGKWKKIDFSDESSMELHPKRRKYCRRPSGSRLDPRLTQKTVQYGGGKTMVWGCMQYGGEVCKVHGNIDSAQYHKILTAHYIPKRGPIFQQDGAPSHTLGSTKGKKIKILQRCPAQFPVLSITEHIWGRMKEVAWKTKSKNLKELNDCQAAFHAMRDDFINELYDSLPNRMATMLQAYKY